MIGVTLAATNFMLKNFSEFKGLDFRSSNLTRSPQHSSGMLNAMYSETGSIVKRPGFQYKTKSIGGIGLSKYVDVNTVTGAVTEKLVTVGDSLYTLEDDSFSVTYSGSGIALMSIKPDVATNKLVLTITEDTTEILSSTLGVGLDESSTTLVSAIISAIDALTDYAASGGTSTGDSAAFFDQILETQLSSTATSISYKYWSQANESVSNPLATSLAAINDTDFEGATFANLNNILYVNTGYDKMHKYDGQTFYRAGLPIGGDAEGAGSLGVAPSIADSSGGSTFTAGDDYFYFYTYIQVDNKGNLIEGEKSPYSSKHTMTGSVDIDVTVTNLSATSGFNTNCAIVNGAQNAVTTITVDSGHTLNIGDTAYFYDGSTSDYVTREITGTTSTSISFSGAVDVADNAVISNNLRIAIYRTVEIGAATSAAIQSYSLVAEIPNDSIGTATQVYTDSTSDANLGLEFVEPIKAHGLPPVCRYTTTFRSQMFLTGDPENVNTVYYSDIDSPEYFPSVSNSFLVDAFPGSKARGIHAIDSALIVFKDKSIQAVTGDIALDEFRVDEISYGGIGCVSNNSIKRVERSLFFLSETGVHAVNLEGVVPVGAPIETEFTKYNVNFNFQKSTAINWVDENKYILFMPVEAQDGSSNYYASSDSVCYVFDYSRGSWLKWNNINAQGGFSQLDDELYFHARRLDSDSAAVEMPLAKFHDYGNVLDYCDHNEAIDFNYETHWESLGEPQLLKKFLRLKVFALSSDVYDGEPTLFTLTVEQEINYRSPAPIASFDMNFGAESDGWGAAWGSTPWGDSPIPELKGKLRSSKSRSLKLKFLNSTMFENVLISGYQIEAVAPYRQFFKE